MKTLVFIEQNTDGIKPGSLEALCLARSLSSDVTAIIKAQHNDSIVEALSLYGANKIQCLKLNKEPSIFEWVDVLTQVITKISPEISLFATSSFSQELVPRLSIRTKSAQTISDVISLEIHDESFVATKPLYASKIFSKITGVFKDGHVVMMIRPNVFKSTQADKTTSQIDTINIEISDETNIHLKEVINSNSETVDIIEADKVIAGGRAIGSADGFEILNNCAKRIGGAVAATRAAVDAGYAPHNIQVGQTGKTINPDLYIACGLSGSIQHLAGMKSSKVIVAINNDPDAPIFSVADYGIIGDVFEVLPILSEQLMDL